MGHLICFDKANGDILWKKDLNEEYEIRPSDESVSVVDGQPDKRNTPR